MDLLPDRTEDSPQGIDAEVIDPEIMGSEPPPLPWWKRIILRAALIAFLAVLGLGLCAVGLLLTLTIVGASIGVPIMAAGLMILIFLVILILSAGRIKIN